MARSNEILTGRHNRALQKLFSMKGGPPAPQLASEIATQIAFNQMGVDFRYLEGWSLFWNVFVLGPSVGNNNGLQLRNPLSNSLMVVIESLKIWSAVADVFTLSMTRYDVTTANLTNIGNATAIDSRRGIQGSTAIGSSLILSSFSPVANFAITPQQYDIGAPNAPTDVETILTDDAQWIIAPGETYRLTNLSLNVVTRVNIKWRERFLEDSERT